MPDLAQKRSILEPFLGSKKYNTCFIGYFKTKEHAWTKKYCLNYGSGSTSEFEVKEVQNK